jgi:hypothetical protein
LPEGQVDLAVVNGFVMNAFSRQATMPAMLFGSSRAGRDPENNANIYFIFAVL